jgi:uncharacterized alpha-E superfamily protein
MEDEYRQIQQQASGRLATLIDFLVLDEANPSSIVSSIGAARRNAREERNNITVDVWESLNGLWLELNERLRVDRAMLDRGALIESVKKQAVMIFGAAQVTLLRDEAYNFLQLGAFLERADNTARILDVKYHVLLPRDEGVGGAVDYYQWTTVLRAVSAVRAYHWVYRTEVVPWHVAELLLLRPEMPRSLRSCYDTIENVLAQSSERHDGGTGACHALASALAGKFRKLKMAEIFRAGLHEELTSIVQDTAKLGDEISAFYMR